jgi:uncharacterized RDD family membrane protein YckC
MNYAGVGVRFVATVIDAAILFPVFYVLASMSGQTTQGGFELSGVPFFIALAIGIGYYVVLEATRGASVGKMVVGLRVTKDDGGSIGWSESAIRNVLRIVDGLFFYLIAAIFVWASDNRKRLGDRVAGTVVLRDRKAPVEPAKHNAAM